ncbi:hypothetical protein TYRP_009622 [Tyrophagus putrescentiae]|nr:hypothetical protein TYRP_009622 [Tyrophagus putrescentiae]
MEATGESGGGVFEARLRMEAAEEGLAPPAPAPAPSTPPPTEAEVKPGPAYRSALQTLKQVVVLKLEDIVAHRGARGALFAILRRLLRRLQASLRFALLREECGAAGRLGDANARHAGFLFQAGREIQGKLIRMMMKIAFRLSAR